MSRLTRPWTIAVTICLTATAVAQDIDLDTRIKAQTDSVRATIVDQPSPVFPSSVLRTGQEGWVRVHFVVAADGRAVDPIIVDSAGGRDFGTSALEALDRWRFEAGSGAEIPANIVEFRFEIYRRRDAATSRFLRHYKRIMTLVVKEETESARKQADQTAALRGWNSYELTMLSLMLGRIEGLENDSFGKRKYYRRALGLNNRKAISNRIRRDMLSRIFEIEFAHRLYGEATRTIAALRAVRGNDDDGQFQSEMEAIRSALADTAPIAASAKILNPCDCDDGRPLWSYAPARREFSFAGLDGNVESFEARCERGRLQGSVETDAAWALPAEWGSCTVFVFGDEGARFDFIELSDERPLVEPPSIAGTLSHALD